MTDYETVIIPDVDIEETLHKVLINNDEYFIGKTGYLYHKDRYIVGRIQDWDDNIIISKDEEISVKVKPVLGYSNIVKINKQKTKKKSKRGKLKLKKTRGK